MKPLKLIAIILTSLTFQSLEAASTLPYIKILGVKVNGLSNAVLKNYNNGRPIAAKLITDNTNHLYIYVLGPGSNSNCMNSITSVNTRLQSSSSASIDLVSNTTVVVLGRNASNNYPIIRMYVTSCTEK